MRTFRKENGGYTLLHVMVMITVLAGVVMAVSAIAIDNYKAQKDSVDQMTAKYAVMGEVEKKLAILESDFVPEGEFTPENLSDYSAYLMEKVFSGEDDDFEINGEDEEYRITFEERNDVIGVKVEIEIKVELVVDEGEGTLTIKPTIQITEYTVEVIDGGAA